MNSEIFTSRCNSSRLDPIVCLLRPFSVRRPSPRLHRGYIPDSEPLISLLCTQCRYQVVGYGLFQHDVAYREYVKSSMDSVTFFAACSALFKCGFVSDLGVRACGLRSAVSFLILPPLVTRSDLAQSSSAQVEAAVSPSQTLLP